MDVILNELGAKWGTLSKDTQIATAQTVAGVRQYAQLIALMDNWSTFQENLNTAYSSTGELERQAEVYAESWEASSKRVRAAAEGIYDSLIDEDFFIGINNGLEGTLGIIEKLIDSLGGLPGVLAVVVSALLRGLDPNLTKEISRSINNLPIITDGVKGTARRMQDEANEALLNADFGRTNDIAFANLQNQSAWTNELANKVNNNEIDEFSLNLIKEKMGVANNLSE